MNILQVLVKLRDDIKLWVANNLRTKVDKVEGKELSTNDFTNDDKDKLSNTASQTDLNNVKTELSESIASPGDAFEIADKDSNIIFRVDAEGVHTTDLTLGGKKVDPDNRSYVNIIYSPDELTTLLNQNNVGKSYLYMGESTSSYDTGCIYQVQEPMNAATDSEMNAILSSAAESDVGKLVRFTGTGSATYETNTIYIIETSEE